MAAFLNKPSDFAKTNLANMDAFRLMPPCAYEKTSQPKKSQADKSRDVEMAKEEINKLRQEIEALKFEKQKNASIQSTEAPRVHITRPSLSNEETRYADELINRQAQEIESLKSEKRIVGHEHKKQLADLEGRLSVQEHEAAHRVSTLEMVVRDNEERYENQVDRLSLQHQQEMDSLSSALDTATQELDQKRSQYATHLRGVQAELDSLRSESEATIARLEAEIRSRSQQTNSLSQQVIQLKTYIGETEKSYKPAEMCKRERETLSNKLQVCLSEKENLQSNMDLLNIRLEAMSQILSVQETEISRNQSKGISDNKTESLIISKWRDQVFALLVQQKSTDYVQKKDEQNWKEKISDLNAKLRSMESCIEVLKHSLSEKGAQLQMEHNACQQYQEEITQAQQVALCLDDNLAQNWGSAESLQQFACGVQSQFEENLKRLHTFTDTLRTYGQRISFASGRVDMLQGQFARKEAFLRLQTKDQDVEVPEEKAQVSDHTDRVLSEELDRVTGERDLLTAQIQQDAGFLTTKLDQARAQYEGEIVALKQTVEDLEVTVQQKSQTCMKLSEKLEQTQTDLDEVSEKLTILRSELAKQDLICQTALEEQRKVDREEYAEQLADMDRKLNEARREHTKAVVSVRQMERQSGRELERLRGQLETSEERHRQQSRKLQQQLAAMEQERNIMMATLRQEGLMSKIRSDRGEPATLQVDTDETDVVSVLPADTHTLPTDTSPAEPISTVVADLRSLTAAVLEDVDESDEADDS